MTEPSSLAWLLVLVDAKAMAYALAGPFSRSLGDDEKAAIDRVKALIAPHPSIVLSLQDAARAQALESAQQAQGRRRVDVEELAPQLAPRRRRRWT